MGDAPATYRAGIIGLGFIGAGDDISGARIGQRVADLDGNHLEALSHCPRIELVCGSSRDQGRRERFTERTGLRAYSDWNEMLEREALDIVSVATFTPNHPEIVHACADRSIPAIWCEKPIANNLADAERMIEHCEQKNTLLVINHNRRFNPNYRRLRDLIAAGKLGELTNAYVRWGAGRLGNLGTHLFDAVRLLVGREIVAVSGHLDLSCRPDCRGSEFCDPGGWGMLRFEENLILLVSAADWAAGPAYVQIDGTKGRAITGMQEVQLEWWTGKNETLPSLRAEASSMDRCAREIVECLDRDKAGFSCPAAEAIKPLEAIVAFHVSHERQAAWVNLPLLGDDRLRCVNSA